MSRDHASRELEGLCASWADRMRSAQEPGLSPLAPAEPLPEGRDALGSRRKRRVAARRLNVFAASEQLERAVYDRPKTRGECANGERPCPFVSCEHHLYLEVSPTGEINLRFPHLEVWELRETCALDIADGEGATLEEIGELVNVTRERIRQVEERAIAKVRTADRRLGHVLADLADTGRAAKPRSPTADVDDSADDPEPTDVEVREGPEEGNDAEAAE